MSTFGQNRSLGPDTSSVSNMLKADRRSAVVERMADERSHRAKHWTVIAGTEDPAAIESILTHLA